jgi:hypothetical protein
MIVKDFIDKTTDLLPMANKLDNLNKGNGFDKYPERINRSGRPVKLTTKLNEIGYSNSQVLDTIKNILALNEFEVKEIEDNEAFTILERTIAKALLNDLFKGSLHTLELLITRVYGKPRETSLIQPHTKIEVVYVEDKPLI